MVNQHLVSLSIHHKCKKKIAMKIALFPGSFDPFTIAHLDILKRALPLFDKVVVGIGLNGNKKSYLTAEKRISMIQAAVEQYPNVEVDTYVGLTIDFCHRINASHMVRGIRSVSDFEYERAIAQINAVMKPDIETIFILSKPEYSAISSTIVRDILLHHGDVSQFVPKSTIPFL